MKLIAIRLLLFFTAFSSGLVNAEVYRGVNSPAPPPPAGFPKGVYYRPFIDGGKECKAIGNITVALADSTRKAGCTFALFDSVHGEVQDRWGVSIGAAWSHGKSTLDHFS